MLVDVSIHIEVQVLKQHTYVFGRQEDLLPVYRSIFCLFEGVLVAFLALDSGHFDVILLLLKPHLVVVRLGLSMRSCSMAIDSYDAVVLSC